MASRASRPSFGPRPSRGPASGPGQLGRRHSVGGRCHSRANRRRLPPLLLPSHEQEAVVWRVVAARSVEASAVRPVAGDTGGPIALDRARSRHSGTLANALVSRANCGKVARSTASQAEGRGFEPRFPLKFQAVAKVPPRGCPPRGPLRARLPAAATRPAGSPASPGSGVGTDGGPSGLSAR